MDRFTILLVLFLVAAATPLRAQKFPSKGIPQIHNYTPERYGSTGKVWDIKSAKNGILYFATDRGLLEYDGANWETFPGSRGFTRSVLLKSDSIVFTGADKDFGRWEKTARGHFRYASLNPFRESAKGLNQEFWGTYQVDEDIVFVSFDNLYVYKSEQLTQVAAPSRFTGSFAADNKVFLADETKGLFTFDGLSLRPFDELPASGADPVRIVGVQESDRGVLVVTRNQGLFRRAQGQWRPIDNEVSQFLKRDQVFSFTAIEDTHYAFGTILNGVYITDLEGRIIQHINKRKGLLNNTVLSLHYSKQGKLWMGMDYGIAAIDLWSDLAYFLDQDGQVGTGQAALLSGGTFYLGTNQGLYYIPWQDLENDHQVFDFSLVPGSSGQVWSLSVMDNLVLCGHDRGLFALRGGRFRSIHDEPGVLSITQIDDTHLVTGTYNGISLFAQNGEGWSFVKKLPPIQGAVSQVKVHHEHLWMNLPNFGIIKATLSEDYQITDQEIFPLDTFGTPNLEISLEADTLRVIGERAVFQYSPRENRFTSVLGTATVREVKQVIPGIFLPQPLNEDFGFYPVFNGFALQNIGDKGQSPSPPPLSIRQVQAFHNDTTQYVSRGGLIAKKMGNLRFHFVVPQHGEANYQYRLSPLQEDWSSWSPSTRAEFLNLSAGDYQFQVRAKVNGQVGSVREYPFSVTTPWYRSSFAYLAYGFLLVAGVLLNHFWQKKRIRTQHQEVLEREKYSLQEKAIFQERENLTKRYRMMEEAIADVKKQLRSKTIELAKKAKESEEKGRVLQAMKEKIAALEKGDSSPQRLAELKRMLAHFPETEDSSFGLQMEELHHEFLSIMSSRYPDLTNYDLRLCAYLKTGLSTREIAGLMNVLPSSVNVSRSRLRKKLGLASKVDLYKFLNGIERS